MAMDEDTRQAFASIASALQRLDANQSAGNALQIETAREFRSGLVALNGRVDGLVLDVNGLKKHVFGSDPPPPDSPHTAIVGKVSEHDNEIATLAGQVIAANAKADRVIEMQEAQNKVLAEQNAVLAEQNKMLAVITKSVGGFLGHPLVRKVALAVGFAILAYFNRDAAAHLVGLQ
jgi:hypothetical protein